jgi:putative flavoprotein involved in K+ transport
VFTPKDKMGDWLEMYARVMELDCWNSTACSGARYDAQQREWEVQVTREGQPVTLRPKHLVLATGMSGFPNVPALPGASGSGGFEGRVLHSSQFDGGPAWRDKHCVVLGANNSAHDIAADLWEQDAASVTLVQRSSTVVATSEALMEHAWGRLYSQQALEAGITTDLADLTVASVPFRVLPQLQQPVYQAIRRRDAALYDGLERAGFLYDFGEDGAGIHATYLRRGSGYYIDVGASQMLIDGRIQLRRGSIERLEARSVHLSDGSALPADLVVLATGYGNMRQWAAQLISEEVAAKVGPVWGLGSDTRYDPGPWVGELRNMWQPTPQEALWFHGGNLMQARHYSLYLALQLKARMEGLSTPVF